MILIGGGDFLSDDIHGAGIYPKTTITEIKGKTYLGWALGRRPRHRSHRRTACRGRSG